MRWVTKVQSEEGFTLVELIVGTLITGLIVAAIGSALIVTFRTTNATTSRMSENHDVQITSSYLANDVQSASSVSVGATTGNCSGAFIPLVTFTYGSSGTPSAIYKCGTASNGETRVTRTFAGGTPLVLAHFAGSARPGVSVAYDPSQPTVPVSVTMTFTKASDCTLDCTYTLFGSRRGYNSSTSGGGTTSGGDTTLLSTGTSSPLWVQGSCPDPGTSNACIVDTTKTALPIADVQTAGWTVPPLWSKLNDGLTTTSVSSTLGSKAEARVQLAGVDPPDPGVNPTVEFHGTSNGGALKVAVSLYNGPTLLVTNNNVGPVNQSKNYDWTLTAAQTSSIPAAAYANLTVGFSVPSAKATDSLTVDGIALDTLDVNAVGLLTINGPLYVNSQLSSAVRLTGTKTANKITINNGNFQIWSPGACSGCNHTTVACLQCTWNGNQPWTSYSQSIPDPLRSLPAPDPSSLPAGGCNGSGVCTPGVYPTTLSRTSNTTFQPGIYYLQQGLSVTGSASLTCPTCTGGQGVLLYIASGSVTFAGSSSVNLTASNTGLYKSILIFQARTDPSELKITGNAGSSATNVLNGIVYVPNSVQVTLATGSASLSAKAIVAQNIKVSSAVTLG